MPATVPVSPKDTYYPDFYGNLGSFWTRLFQDKLFPVNKSRADSLELAQLYLNLAEAAACLGRSTVPAFHREKWFPIVIRRSEQNSGDGVKLYVGITPAACIGPQPPDTAYTPSAEFAIGGDALKQGFVSYPMHASSFQKGVDTVCSAIISPAAIYVRGVDYYTARDSIVFKAELDPFADTDKFPQRLVYVDGAETYEIVLWGSDALVDARYPFDHFGYMQSMFSDDPETEAVLSDAALELRSSGTALFLLRKNLGRLFDTAVVLEDGETIYDMAVNADGSTSVMTDKRVYRIRAEEQMLDSVVKGAVFSRGDFLAHTLRFYAQLDPDRFLLRNGLTLDQFIIDVPALSLSSGMVHAEAFSGSMVFTWEEAAVTWHGWDLNGHPKLSFPVSNDTNVDSSYWTSVWTRAEKAGISMEDMLDGFVTVPEFPVEGQEVGSLRPLEYAMRNCLSSNTSVLVVDLDASPEYIRAVGVMAELWRVLPAHSIMLVTMNRTVGSEEYDCGTLVVDGIAPCLPVYADEAELVSDFPDPEEGDRAIVLDTDTVWEYDGADWIDTAGAPPPCVFFGQGARLEAEEPIICLEHKLKIKELPSCVRNNMPAAYAAR